MKHSCTKAMKRIFLLLAILFNCSIYSQPKADFGLSLMKERDYFRAISVYKELAFFSKDKDSSIYFYSQIGKAYRLSKKYDLSISTYSNILGNNNLADSIAASLYLNLGLNYLGMNVPSQAIVYFKEAQKIDNGQLPLFYLGLASVETSDWSGAINYYDQSASKSAASNIGMLSTAFSKKIQDVDKVSTKSPLLATLFSIIIPGSGQWYCGHYVDAVQAFAFVSVFSFASYLAYQNDKKNNSNYVLTGISLSITGLFHLANIIGAGRTATYYNQRQRELFIQEIKEKSYNVD